MIDNLEGEIWLPIKGYEGLYEVSNMGRIYSHITNKILSLHVRGMYYHVCLCKDGKRKNFLVHRLVAKMFVDNPYNLPIVNHKDENKFNNFSCNLEWCTQEYNMAYSKVHQKAYEKMRKPVKMYSLNGEFEKEFVSLREAAGFLGENKQYGNIISACVGRHKSCEGHLFCFKGEENRIKPTKSTKREVLMYDKNNNLQNKFESIASAARFVKGKPQPLRESCLHPNRTYKGYVFKFNDNL